MAKKKFDNTLPKLGDNNSNIGIISQEKSNNTANLALRMNNAKILPMANVHPDPNQPRKTFDEEKFEGLKRSIDEFGLMQPIVVKLVDKKEQKYQIIAGERRYRACKDLGLDKIQAVIISDKSEDDVFGMQFVENVNREDLSVLEKANALKLYQDMTSYSWTEIEKKLGLSKRNRIRYTNILSLSDETQGKVSSLTAKGIDITLQHYEALKRVDGAKELKEKLFERIENENISGQEALDFISKSTKKVKPVSNERKSIRITYNSREELIVKLREVITGHNLEEFFKVKK